MWRSREGLCGFLRGTGRMRRSLGDLRDPRPSGDAQRRLKWEEDTLRVRWGCGGGVKRGTTGDRVETPGQNSPPTGTVSPRPRSRGPQAHRQGDLPEAAGAGGGSGPRTQRTWWEPGHDPHPCPRGQSHRCHRSVTGPRSPTPQQQEGVCGDLKAQSSCPSRDASVDAPQAAVAQRLLTA